MGLRIPDRLFARYYDRATAKYERAYAERKRALFADLGGTVVEIGPGTGVNLELMPMDLRWIGVEPNAHMHLLLRAKAKAQGREVDLRELSAGALPLGDGEADAVVSTLVLCSVPDVDAVLREIVRVLRPGGRFVFWEHVIAPSGRARRFFQHVMTPPQRVFASDCRANRDLAASIEAAGFASVDVERFEADEKSAGVPSWIRPHVCGVATR